jgi:glycosyltransferase involved in cell wall biosynthesis
MILHDSIFYSFTIVVFIQCIYYLFVFGKFAFSKLKPTQNPNQPPVSVIICAKNEAENLKRFIPTLIAQDYPEFEIVLINDASSDATLEVMEAFAAAHANIKIVDVKSVETFWGNKKYALTLGIKAATHDTLVFTDADCQPASNSWIKAMVAPINTDTTIVLGYGAYDTIKGSFLNKLIRFETVTTAMSYLGMAKIGAPYMGVGRNLAYTKATFFKTNGFVKHMKVRSGDDDLFINEAATASNTALCISKNSRTLSIPKTSFATWFKQKRRHISTAKYYKLKHKIVLALFYITNVLFLSLSITLLSLWYKPLYVIGLIVLRFGIQLTTYSKVTTKLHEKGLMPLLPVLEFFLISFQLVIFISNKISKPSYWK